MPKFIVPEEQLNALNMQIRRSRDGLFRNMSTELRKLADDFEQAINKTNLLGDNELMSFMHHRMFMLAEDFAKSANESIATHTQILKALVAEDKPEPKPEPKPEAKPDDTPEPKEAA